MRENDWTRVLAWPGYRVYRHEINETAKTLKLWVRRKRGNRKLVCSGCGRKFADAYDRYEREVRDLPCFEYRTTVVVELYRVRCPDCGLKTATSSSGSPATFKTSPGLLSSCIRVGIASISLGQVSAICHSPVCSIWYMSCQPPMRSFEASMQARS